MNSGSQLTQETDRLGSTIARLKLKGIDGGPHKWWSMWFNAKQRAEPYQSLTYCIQQKVVTLFFGTLQVLHGCRQLVA